MVYYDFFGVFHLCKVLFSGFLQCNGNFVDGQNNSKYRDCAALSLIVIMVYWIRRIDGWNILLCNEKKNVWIYENSVK